MPRKTPSNPEIPNKGKVAASERRKVYTIATLKDQSRKLEILNIEMQVAVKAAENSGIRELLVDGAKKFDQAVDSLGLYINNLHTAIRKINFGSALAGQIKQK